MARWKRCSSVAQHCGRLTGPLPISLDAGLGLRGSILECHGFHMTIFGVVIFSLDSLLLAPPFFFFFPPPRKCSRLYISTTYAVQESAMLLVNLQPKPSPVASAQMAHWGNLTLSAPSETIECLSWVGDDPQSVTPDDPRYLRQPRISAVGAALKHCRAERHVDPRERLCPIGFYASRTASAEQTAQPTAFNRSAVGCSICRLSPSLKFLV